MLLWLHVSFRCLAVLNKMKLIRLACTANILFKANLLHHESLLHQTADWKWNSSFLPWEGQQIKLQSYINICGRNVERCYFGAIQVQIWAKLHQSHNCLLNLTKHVGAPNVKLKGRLFIRHTVRHHYCDETTCRFQYIVEKSHSIRNWNPQPCLSKYLRSWISYFHHRERKGVGRGGHGLKARWGLP